MERQTALSLVQLKISSKKQSARFEKEGSQLLVNNRRLASG